MKKTTLPIFLFLVVPVVYGQQIEIDLPLLKNKKSEINIQGFQNQEFEYLPIEKFDSEDLAPFLLRDKLLLRHPSYYRMDPSDLTADFERYRKEIETDSFYISPAVWAPYTNQKYRKPWLENDLQVESLHGEMYLIPKPDYSKSRSLFPEGRKSYREQRKLRMLKYITEEVYPTKDSIP